VVKVSTQLIIVLLLASTISGALAAPPAKSPGKRPAQTAPARKAAPPAASSGASSAACNTYAGQLREKMAKSWNCPTGKNHVTLTIDVNQDGSVSNLTLASSPKNNEAEQKANDAFNSAQPLSALPSGITQAKITAVLDSQADQWDTKANMSVKIDPVKTAASGSEAKSGDAPDAAKKEEKEEKDNKEDKK
jgi:TonB family protein